MSVLAIGCHSDDIVIGCGGTLRKYIDSGHTVYGMTLTDSETHFYSKDIHRTSQDAAIEEVSSSNIIGYKLIDIDQCSVGGLLYNDSTMKVIEKFIFDFGIKTIFTHWRNDLNVDHKECFKIVSVAARHVQNILTFRTNWYFDTTNPITENVFSDITKTVKFKESALNCFVSEIANRGRDWIDSFIWYNKILGIWRNTEYVEPFECVKIKLEI